mmetsp:Transcript_32111/g.79568  ORF Transcript_32111/g.79568 Transcript_32111/m.79568 type:complete len:97 (+) Transcript_32111:479-769(+)
MLLIQVERSRNHLPAPAVALLLPQGGLEEGLLVGGAPDDHLALPPLIPPPSPNHQAFPGLAGNARVTDMSRRSGTSAGGLQLSVRLHSRSFGSQVL